MTLVVTGCFCVWIGTFLLAVFCWGRPCLPLFLHRHALMPLQQLGPCPGGAEESIRLHLPETPNSEVHTV